MRGPHRKFPLIPPHLSHRPMKRFLLLMLLTLFLEVPALGVDLAAMNSDFEELAQGFWNNALRGESIGSYYDEIRYEEENLEHEWSLWVFFGGPRMTRMFVAVTIRNREERWAKVYQEGKRFHESSGIWVDDLTSYIIKEDVKPEMIREEIAFKPIWNQAVDLFKAKYRDWEEEQGRDRDSK